MDIRNFFAKKPRTDPEVDSTPLNANDSSNNDMNDILHDVTECDEDQIQVEVQDTSCEVDVSNVTAAVSVASANSLSVDQPSNRKLNDIGRYISAASKCELNMEFF